MKIDKYLHCVGCGDKLYADEFIDGKIKRRLLSSHDEYEYKLNDGSHMRVCMCKTCKSNINKINHKEVMETVINGWKLEVQNKSWNAERKKMVIDKYSKLKIVKDKIDKEKSHGINL